MARRTGFLWRSIALVSGLVVLAWVTGLETRAAAPAAEKRVTLKVEGMTCSGCAAAVKMTAEKVDGVKKAEVSYEKGTAEVTYDPEKTTPEAIAKAITQNSGFKATAPKAEARR